ncbi:MAG: hypothetical protein IT258_23180 [Saprospiraceae bacterium]|nr:hypothetical protein [Saprospiraceae bacterium]
MKKSVIQFLSVLLFAAAIMVTSCREGGAEQSTTTNEPAPDSTQAVEEAIAAPVDSLAKELDETADEIEQDAKELESALDSL